MITNLPNLQQENGTLLMTKIIENISKGIKMIQPLNDSTIPL